MKQHESMFGERPSGRHMVAGQTIEAKSVAGKLLLLIVVLLMCIGVVVVYSSGAGWAQRKFSNPEYFLWRQVFYTFLGVVTVILFSSVDYQIFRKLSKVLFFVSIVLLAGLLFFKFIGVVKGAARWIHLGPFSFQVSDFAKYALISESISIVKYF